VLLRILILYGPPALPAGALPAGHSHRILFYDGAFLETEASSTVVRTPPGGGAERRRKAELILLTITLIWGATFGVTKSLLETMQPMGLLTWRFGLSAIIFYIFHRTRLARKPNRGELLRGLLLGIFLYLGFALQTFGLAFTSSSRSGLITSLYVVMTPILQIVVIRRIPSARVFSGILIVLLGLWGLTAPGGTLSGMLEPWKAGGFGLGDALTLGGAFSFAIYIIMLDRYARNANIVLLTALQLGVMALLSAAHCLATETWTCPTGAAGWGQILYLAIFATVLSTYGQTLYQRDTTPTRAAIIYTMEAVFAAAIGVLLLDEHLGGVGLAGAALIVAGLLVVQLAGES